MGRKGGAKDSNNKKEGKENNHKEGSQHPPPSRSQSNPLQKQLSIYAELPIAPKKHTKKQTMTPKTQGGNRPSLANNLPPQASHSVSSWTAKRIPKMGAVIAPIRKGGSIWWRKTISNTRGKVHNNTRYEKCKDSLL